MEKDSAGEIGDERQGLGMEIAKHCVGFPPAHEADGVSVNSAAQESHGAAGSEASRIDVRWLEVEIGKGTESET